MSSQCPVCSSVSLRSEVDLHILCKAPRLPYCRVFTLQTINTTLRAVIQPRRSYLSAELSLGPSASSLRFLSSFRVLCSCIFYTDSGTNQPYIKLVLSVSFTKGKEVEAWSWTLTSIYCQGLVELYIHSSKCLNALHTLVLSASFTEDKEAETWSWTLTSAVRDWWSYTLILLNALMPCINWFWVLLLPRIKRSKREVEHSPLLSGIGGVIQGVPGGMGKTSRECSLCGIIPI